MVNFVREYLPLVIMGSIIGTFTLLFVLGWLALRKHKE